MNYSNLLFLLLIAFFSGRNLAQNSTNDSSRIRNKKEKLELKAYQNAKNIKYCTGIQIDIDTLQYADGTDKYINYKIVSTHIYKNKTYTFLNTNKEEFSKDFINSTNLIVTIQGVSSLEKEENRVLIKGDLSNCKNASFTINAELKTNKAISDSKSINLLQAKQVNVGLWLSEGSDEIESESIFYKKRIDTNWIDIYFKKFSSDLGRELIFITAINRQKEDTIHRIMDISSSVTFSFYPHLHHVKVIADFNINLQALYFKLNRENPKIQKREFENEDNRDFFMVVPDSNSKLQLLQELMDQKDRENVEVKNLPNYLFKIY